MDAVREHLNSKWFNSKWSAIQARVSGPRTAYLERPWDMLPLGSPFTTAMS